VRSTTGSLFHLPITVDVELENVLPYVRAAGLQLIAADIKGESLLDARESGVLAEPTAWLFGNEARGLTDEHYSLAERAISVPIYGDAESMNLATAAAVCIYESAFAHN
jgi:TrmH family RNA methyltransferase